MFNWFKKNVLAVKVEQERKVPADECGNSITQLAISESKAFLDQGNTFLENGKLEDAAACYRQAIARNPRYADACTNLGYVLQVQGNLEEAIALYRNAVVFNPELLMAHQNLGFALINVGQSDAAEESLRRVVALAPGHTAALQSLGVIAAQRGDFPQAETLLRRVLELQPDNAEVHCNVGNLLLETRRLPEAEASYRRVLELKPDYADAHFNLGTLFVEVKRLSEAESSYRSALALAPGFAKAHNNLALLLVEAKRLFEAEASYRRALELAPDFAEVHNNLAIMFMEAKRPSEAEASYRRALELNPDFADAHNNLGKLLLAAKRMVEAEASFRRVLELKSGYADAHYNLGTLFMEDNRLSEAEASFRRALELAPGFAKAHSNLGNVLQKLGQLDEAVANYRRALEIEPDFAEAYSNLGNALQEFGKLDEAVANYRRALEIKPDFTDAHSNLLMALNYTASHLPSYCLEQARQFGRIVSEKAAMHFSAWQCATRPERLRVGLVSGDLLNHPVGFFLEGILAHIDPARIELIAYSTNPREDELTVRIRPYFAAWKSLSGKSDEAAARLIHTDGVHVLLDLSGHTGHNRLPVFAWKPAPVQVSWLGLPSTTGMAEMDYVLGDPHAIPPEFENHFSEAVWRMPESCLCLTVPSSPVKVVPPPAQSAGYVTFGSFNNLTKMTDAVVAVWVRVLKSVPESRLLLKTQQLNNPGVCEKTRQRFASFGIAPDRLLLSGTLASADDHLAMYNKVDIALDTFPYPGVTTSVEALWMGVPVLSLRGDRFLSRTAGSIAHNAGLPDWIAADEGDYVAKAVAFSSNLESLAALRIGLRQQVLASPLFDAPRFAGNFEAALRGMWQKWCEQHDVLDAAD